mmetsp:Transcript_58896/g.105014  ORF Transcript_58896/g.105014 Transcript_58896/m.105014 type:complete len:110 (-) Transcript_58896:324-653(-)
MAASTPGDSNLGLDPQMQALFHTSPEASTCLSPPFMWSSGPATSAIGLGGAGLLCSDTILECRGHASRTAFQQPADCHLDVSLTAVVASVDRFLGILGASVFLPYGTQK